MFGGFYFGQAYFAQGAPPANSGAGTYIGNIPLMVGMTIEGMSSGIEMDIG